MPTATSRTPKKGVVVAQGDSCEAALEDVRSAVAFHIETFGADAIDFDDIAEEVFIAEAGVNV